MSRSCMILLLVWVTAFVATPTFASPDITYLASSLETLYRVTPGEPLESWDFPGIKLRGMHYQTATREVLVLGDGGGGGARTTVYNLENPVAGTPTLTEYTRLSRQYGSMTQIGQTFYAFSGDELYALDLSDPTEPVETFIGHTGVRGAGGAAYDPASDTLYMMSYRGLDDALYTVDPDDATTLQVGRLGIDALGLGAEWFDGQLFAAAQNASSGYFEIGTVDYETGPYSTEIRVAQGVAEQATALTVIPEPSVLGLFATAEIVLLRRRRR